MYLETLAKILDTPAREESLELYSILDLIGQHQKENRLVAWVRRCYSSAEGNRRPEIRLCSQVSQTPVITKDEDGSSLDGKISARNAFTRLQAYLALDGKLVRYSQLNVVAIH